MLGRGNLVKAKDQGLAGICLGRNKMIYMSFLRKMIVVLVGIVFVILAFCVGLLNDPFYKIWQLYDQGVVVIGVSNESGETIDNIRIWFKKEEEGKVEESSVGVLKPKEKRLFREKIIEDIRFPEIRFNWRGRSVKKKLGSPCQPWGHIPVSISERRASGILSAGGVRAMIDCI